MRARLRRQRTKRLERALDRLLQPGETLLATALGAYDVGYREGALGFVLDAIRPGDPTELCDAIVVTDRRVLAVRLSKFLPRVTRVHAEASRRTVVPAAFDPDPQNPGIELRFANGRVVRFGGDTGLLEDYERIRDLLGPLESGDPLPANTVTPGDARRGLLAARSFWGAFGSAGSPWSSAVPGRGGMRSPR